MRKGRIILSFFLMFTFTFCTIYTPVKAESKTDAENTAYLLKMKKTIQLSDLTPILDQHGFKLIKTFKQINVSVVSNNNSQQVQIFKDEQKDNILYMEIDASVFVVQTSNDKLFPDQDSLKRLNIQKSWDITTGSINVVVAVSDTGIYYHHEDLANQIWTNFKEIPNNSKDDDGNGFVDDVSGWNFITNNGKTMDDHGHGTHVSGIIGAEGNNNFGIAGVNWDISIMPLKFLDKNGSGSTSGGISTILYAADNGAKILNASWGSSNNSAALTDALDYAYSKGMITIAAAGNNSANSDKAPLYPAGSDSEGVIAIASSSADGTLSSFSNFGGISVHLAAPGSNVLSTYLNNTFTRMSGTSMAAPMASGVAALLLSKNNALSALDLRNGLLNSVVLRPSYDGILITEGDLDASITLQEMNDVFKIWPHQININNGDTFQFSAIMPRGLVAWKVNAKDSNLATIDAKGRLHANPGKSGVLTIIATDEQGNEAATGEITVVNANGGGGGCTHDAYAGSGDTSQSPNPFTFLGYALLLLVMPSYKKMRRVFSKGIRE